MLQRLYPLFLDCGYSPLLFAQLSPAEVADLIESHNRRQEQEQQSYLSHLRDNITILDGALCVLLHNLAAMMPGASNAEYLRLQDLFPEIYAEEANTQKSDTNQHKLSPAMQLYKAQRIDHAYRYNASRQRAQGKERGSHGRDDTGKTEGSV